MDVGILSFLIFIGSSLSFPGLWFHHDGNDGTAPYPLVWSAGALPERRRLVHAVRDRAMLPRPPDNWGLLLLLSVLRMLASLAQN